MMLGHEMSISALYLPQFLNLELISCISIEIKKQNYEWGGEV